MNGDALMFHSTYKDLVTEVSRRVRDWQVEHPWATYLQIEAVLDEHVQRARARRGEERHVAGDQSTDPVDEGCQDCSTPNRAGQ